jgi:hypothetical protein
VVANVLLAAAKEGIPVEIFVQIASVEVSSHPQVGARLRTRVKKR